MTLVALISANCYNIKSSLNFAARTRATLQTQPRHSRAGLSIFGALSKMCKDLGQHAPNCRKIYAMVPVGIGPIRERSNTYNNENAPHFSPHGRCCSRSSLYWPFNP